MSEARYLIESLKNRLEDMQEDYDNMEDKQSNDARMLNADIEELTGIIKEYEAFLKKYENMKLDTEFAKKQYDSVMNDVVNRLRAFNEGYARSEEIMSRTTNLEAAIDEIAQTDDSSYQEEKVEEETREENVEVTPTETTTERENEPQPQQTQTTQSETRPPLKGSDSEYQAIMNNRIKKIEEKIAKLKKRPDLMGHKAEAIRGFEIEIAALREEIEHYNERTRLAPEIEETLEEMDVQHAENVTQIKDYEDEIKELKKIREQLTTRKDKREMKRLLKKLEEKKIDLKIEDKRLTDTEGHMMYPEYKDQMKVRTKAASAEGMISSNEDSLAINEEIRAMLDPENSVIDRIKDTFYDIRGDHYRKRIEKGQERLRELQSGDVPVRLNGARVTGMTREYLEGLRNRSTLQPQESMQMAA